MKKPCVFCELSEIRKRAVAENDLAFAFLTNIPITPGHMLVSPKRCVALFSDLTAAEKRDVFALAEKIRVALIKTFNAEGFNWAWNENEIGGQAVPHFHLHLVPRKKGDSGVYEYDPRKFLYRPGGRAESPEAELIATAELIKKAFN